MDEQNLEELMRLIRRKLESGDFAVIEIRNEHKQVSVVETKLPRRTILAQYGK